MKIYLVNIKTGSAIKTGDSVTTSMGLKATVHGFRRDRNAVLLKTQPDSNTWQASVPPSMINARWIN